MSDDTKETEGKIQLPPHEKKPQNMTVREAIAALAQVSELDDEIAISFFNSDPIPVQTIEESEDNLVIISGS